MKKKINKRKEKKSTEAKKLKLDISEFDSKPDLIALGLAAKPDSAPVGSDLGLIAQPDLIAVTARPISFWHKTHKRQRPLVALFD